jgi:hypothetical protein
VAQPHAAVGHGVRSLGGGCSIVPPTACSMVRFSRASRFRIGSLLGSLSGPRPQVRAARSRWACCCRHRRRRARRDRRGRTRSRCSRPSLYGHLADREHAPRPAVHRAERGAGSRRAHSFGVDLGTIEIAPLANVLTPDDVSSVTPVNAPHSEALNATVTQDAPLNARAVNARETRRHPAVNCQRCLD